MDFYTGKEENTGGSNSKKGKSTSIFDKFKENPKLDIYSDILDNSPVGILALTVTGDILYSNKLFLKRFSNQKELVGKNLFNILNKNIDSSEQKEVFKQILSELKENGQYELKDYNMGDEFFNLKFKARINQLGEIQYIILHSEDVTESVKLKKDKENAEQILRRTNKLRFLSTTFGSYAHNVNNMLMGLLGNVDLLELSIKDDELNKDKINERLTAIQKLVKRINVFINETTKLANEVDASIKRDRSTMPSDFNKLLNDLSEMVHEEIVGEKFNKISNLDINMKNLIQFYTNVNKIKKIERTGWKGNGLSSPLDTIASHSFGASLVGWYLATIEGVDVNKVMKLLVIHDLIMAYVDDYTPHDKEYKSKRDIENECSKLLFSSVPDQIKDEFKLLFWEHQKEETTEAKIAREADKLETILQSYMYSLEISDDMCTKFINTYRHKIKSKTGKKILADLEDKMKQFNE